jgi:hypothetical protein
MTGGIKLKKDDQVWADFRVIRDLRDDEWIHQKQSALAMELDDLAAHLNRFRTREAARLTARVSAFWLNAGQPAGAD